jgi:hypothetical protein
MNLKQFMESVMDSYTKIKDQGLEIVNIQYQCQPKEIIEFTDFVVIDQPIEVVPISESKEEPLVNGDSSL